MSFGTVYFQPLSYQQANPFGAGLQQGSQLAQSIFQNQLLKQQTQKQQIENQYLPQMTQQELLAKNLANQLSQATLPYAGPQAQANVGLANAQASQAHGLGGYYGAMGNQITQMTPYEVKKAESTVYTDPILQRAQQISMITGQPVATILDQSGISTSGPALQQTNPPNQQMTPRGMNPAIQNASPTGIPFLTPQQTAQQASSYPVLPGGMSPQQAQMAQQQLGNVGTQVTPTTAPKLFGGDAAQNWLMFGSPYNPIQLAALTKGAETQASTNVNTWNDAQKQVATDSDDATSMQNFLKEFQKNYAESTYVGPRLGSLPLKGAFAAPGDVTPEQNAENAANNMQQLVLKLMHTNRLTNYELQFAANLKLNRNMTPGAVENVGSFLAAKSARLNEQQNFMNAARNQNIDPQTAQTLWQKYNSQRPVYDFETQKKNDDFAGTWKDFLKPEAVNAARTGTPYVNIPTFNSKGDFENWYKNLDAGTQSELKAQMGDQ